MSVVAAIAADRSGAIVEAADLYEEAIGGGDQSASVLLDLLVLYWQATDVGLSSAKRLGVEFIARSGRRCVALLAEAQRMHPRNAEVEFWARYIWWTDFGGEFTYAQCEELFLRDRAILAPTMRLFGETNGACYRDEALELLVLTRLRGTTRDRYVVSVVEGVLKRARGITK